MPLFQVTRIHFSATHTVEAVCIRFWYILFFRQHTFAFRQLFGRTHFLFGSTHFLREADHYIGDYLVYFSATHTGGQLDGGPREIGVDSVVFVVIWCHFMSFHVLCVSFCVSFCHSASFCVMTVRFRGDYQSLMIMPEAVN